MGIFGCGKEVELEERILDLQEELASLQSKYDELDEAIFNDQTESSYAVDFDGMQVVSIERLQRNSYQPAVTVLGFLKNKTDCVGEWYLHCSQETHEQIVEDFKQYLKSKGKGNKK